MRKSGRRVQGVTVTANQVEEWLRHLASEGVQLRLPGQMTIRAVSKRHRTKMAMEVRNVKGKKLKLFVLLLFEFRDQLPTPR